MLIPRVDEMKFKKKCLLCFSRAFCAERGHTGQPEPLGAGGRLAGGKDSGSLPACLAERPTDYSLMAVDVKADEVITRPAWCGRARPCDKVNPPCVRESGLLSSGPLANVGD